MISKKNQVMHRKYVMKQHTDFIRERHEQEAHQWDRYISGNEVDSHAESWLKTDTVDYWRHERMYDCLRPILTVYPESEWLTIGDGRFGRDANYIKNFGCKATASDISETLLSVGKKRNYIDGYSVENAENLSFDDNSFDFVFSKECLHHLPRPYLGIYEALRVARKGVFFIEPAEAPLVHRPRSIIKTLAFLFADMVLKQRSSSVRNQVKRRSVIREYQNEWEEVGNYLFRLSQREIEKIAHALNYGFCAFRFLNDAYVAGVETAKLSAPIFEEVRDQIEKKNKECENGFHQKAHSLMACLILKTEPDNTVLNVLQQNGYKVINLPLRPEGKEKVGAN